MSRKPPAQPSPDFCDQGNLGPQLKSICTVFFQFTEKKKNVADEVSQQRKCFFYALLLPT